MFFKIDAPEVQHLVQRLVDLLQNPVTGYAFLSDFQCVW